MRRLLSFVLLSSLCFAACGKKEEATKEEAKKEEKSDKAEKTEKADEGLTIKAKAPAVGDKVEEKMKNDLSVSIEIDVGGKKTSEFTELESSDKKTEALAVDGNAITKAKVTYVEHKKADTEDGKEKKKPKSLLDGKTFILELKDGKVVATDEAGKKLPKADEEAILKKNHHFGKPDPFLEGMPKKAIKVGDKVDSLAKALEEHFKNEDDGKDPFEITGTEVKLESIEKDGKDQIGVFSVSLTMQSPKNSKEPVALKFVLKGTTKVRAKDGFTTAIDMKGPVTMDSSDPKLKLTGKGKAHMEQTSSEY